MTGVDGIERRTCRRYPFRHEVGLVTSRGSIKGRISDIGMGGVSVESSQMAVGARLTLDLPLPDPSHSSDTKRCRVDGKVVWRRGDRAGIQFVEPDFEFTKTLSWFAKRFLRTAPATEALQFIDSLFEEPDETN